MTPNSILLVAHKIYHIPGEGLRGQTLGENCTNCRPDPSLIFFALTKVRLLALRANSPIINVPLADGRIRAMRYSLEKGDSVLCIAFDAGLFHDDWSGTIEYRFRTPEAQQFLKLLLKQPV